MRISLLVSSLIAFTLMFVSHLEAGPSTQPDDEGLVTVSKTTMESPGSKIPPQQMVMKIKGHQMRMNIDSMISVIILENGNTVTLMHPNRVAMTTTAGQMKEGLEQTASTPDNPEEAPKLIATGQKQKIGTYETEAYSFKGTVNGQTSKFVLWFAPEYPDAKRIMAKMVGFFTGNKSTKLMWTLLPGLSPKDLPNGVPVRSEIEATNGSKSVGEIISAKIESVDDSEFEIPKDYKQTTMPSAPSGP